MKLNSTYQKKRVKKLVWRDETLRWSDKRLTWGLWLADKRSNLRENQCVGGVGSCSTGRPSLHSVSVCASTTTAAGGDGDQDEGRFVGKEATRRQIRMSNATESATQCPAVEKRQS